MDTSLRYGISNTQFPCQLLQKVLISISSRSGQWHLSPNYLRDRQRIPDQQSRQIRLQKRL